MGELSRQCIINTDGQIQLTHLSFNAIDKKKCSPSKDAFDTIHKMSGVKTNQHKNAWILVSGSPIPFELNV